MILFLTMSTLVLQTAKVEQVKFDVMQLHARPELAARHRMVDDASGDVKVREKNYETSNPKIHTNIKDRSTCTVSSVTMPSSLL